MLIFIRRVNNDQAQFDGKLATAAYMLTHPKVAARALALTLGKKVKSVRTEEYWAGGAYRLGEKAMKYSAKPCAKTPAPVDTTFPHNSFIEEDYLREDLARFLDQGELCFDFYVQMQNDAVKQSIEDSSVEWKSSEAPAIPVARVTIPTTHIGVFPFTVPGNKEEACNELSFNPWNSSEDYRPLGNVNRSRRSAYKASRNMRKSAAEPLEFPLN